MTATATGMDDYLDSPVDSDDVFPCKGCGEILEEGKAFELAGNRWHLNCFRCNTCGTLLDSDANLLLLGDGSLICNNCTYSCSACSNKIEDLAILAGDQAFCASCFRCRNCKRKIENLRYARTSQGIFCMSCHESLMARKRKKSKAAQQAKAREKDASPMLIDKSLPALPPNAVPPSTSKDRVSPDSDTPTELSPRPRGAYTRNDSSSRSSSRPAPSPERGAESQDSGLALPSKSYRNNRNSTIVASVDGAGVGPESFLIPVALDPSPAPSATSRSTTDNFDDTGKGKEKDCASTQQATEKGPLKPQNAFQEKGHQPSSDYESPPPPLPARRVSKSAKSDINTPSKEKAGQNDEFRLQDVPKSKKTPNESGQILPRRTESLRNNSSNAQSQLPPSEKTSAPPRSSQDARMRDEDVKRPSIDNSTLPPRIDSQNAIVRKELPPSAGRNLNGKLSATARTGTEERVPQPVPTSGHQSPHARLGASKHKLTDTYMEPRAAPIPLSTATRASNEPAKTNDPPSPKTSPKLPRWSSGGEFSMDEDMARILGTDEGSSSLLRRVSNAVRHGRTNSTETTVTVGRPGHVRSMSETVKGAPSPTWPKTPGEEHNSGHAQGTSSPISLSSSDDPALLKRQLRNSEQRVAELERQFKSENDLKNLSKKLVEKRKTVLELDTQTEMLIQQLEVLTSLVAKAKSSQQAIDMRELEDSAMKDFLHRLDRVKQKFTIELEQIIAARDEIEEQRNRAVADRDRALVEFEQISTKNAQLADLNNDLTHQIQERFKAQTVIDPKSPNGLGLGLVGQQRGSSPLAVLPDSASCQTGTTTVSNDHDETVLEPGVAAVKIGKGQVKKFNWKKGTSKTMQSVAKGVKGAVVAFQTQQQERSIQHGGIDTQSIGVPYEATRIQLDSPISIPQNGQQHGRQAGEQGRFGGLFRGKNNQLVQIPKSMSSANICTQVVAEAASTLFGSDLSERADYERRQIPCVVTRCIEEVELRGMDIEGIYRKTGGTSQVKMIQDGFDRSEDYDISDPSIDITAVTSVLKQYFRKLPVPLLTFDVYDRILESNTITSEDERVEHLQITFNILPEKHKDCLEFLIFHLARVAKREPENLMSPKNLAVVFAPTIMRERNIEREMSDMHAKNLAVQFVIENSDRIF